MFAWTIYFVWWCLIMFQNFGTCEYGISNENKTKVACNHAWYIDNLAWQMKNCEIATTQNNTSSASAQAWVVMWQCAWLKQFASLFVLWRKIRINYLEPFKALTCLKFLWHLETTNNQLKQKQKKPISWAMKIRAQHLGKYLATSSQFVLQIFSSCRFSELIQWKQI